METMLNRVPLADLARQRWDVLVVGGGITGAGVFEEASRLGLKALLLERHDFASGTSSHSAKLIHGGLHYLARLQVSVARQSVRDRDCLLRESAGLIEPLDFILPLENGERLRAFVTTIGLGVYQAMSGKSYRPWHVCEQELARIAPGIDCRYRNALRHSEGQTDDARLTLRTIAAGRGHGGTARNYTEAAVITRGRNGEVTGALSVDTVSGESAAITARHVVNAAGPWSDDLRALIGRPVQQRLVSGSHLVFPQDRLPISTAIAVYHPLSGLPLYLVPWNRVTIAGTTHIDRGTHVDHPARATAEETSYLLQGVRELLPDLDLTIADVQATFSGYRPIVDNRTRDPARASRDYGIWVEDGLITVTGGKLTTYRSMAKQVMRRINPRDRKSEFFDREHQGSYTSAEDTMNLNRIPLGCRQIEAKYGSHALLAFAEMAPDERVPLPRGGGITLAEIRWAARAEDVVHLDDLLFRRVRLALLAPNGGSWLLDRIEPVACQELGWDGARWLAEVSRYRELWNELYAVPDQTTAPDPIASAVPRTQRDLVVEVNVGEPLEPAKRASSSR